MGERAGGRVGERRAGRSTTIQRVPRVTAILGSSRGELTATLGHGHDISQKYPQWLLHLAKCVRWMTVRRMKRHGPPRMWP